MWARWGPTNSRELELDPFGGRSQGVQKVVSGAAPDCHFRLPSTSAWLCLRKSFGCCFSQGHRWFWAGSGPVWEGGGVSSSTPEALSIILFLKIVAVKKPQTPIDNGTQRFKRQLVTNWSGLLGERFGSFCVEVVGLREHREGSKGKEGEREDMSERD